MKMAGLTPPKPLSAYSAQSLCKKFQPFSTSRFFVSFKSNDIATAVKKKGLSPESCMKMAGLTPPKPLSAYDFESICDFSDFDAVILKERKRRSITSLDCQITRRIAFKEQDYLSKTPSKRVTPFLSDLDLCRFLKYKTPPHLTGESKKRGLRCNRLLSLDAFDRSVNAGASDFRIAPTPKQVSAMNDIDLCQHHYVRDLAFIKTEVKNRYLNCTALIATLVEQKQRDRQVKVEQEKVRLAREQRAKEDQAQRERTSAEQARLRAEAAQMAEQRRRLVELQEKQLELQRKQLEAAKSRDRSNALMNLGRALQGYSAQPSYRPAPAPAFNSLKCTTTNNGWNTPTMKCKPSPFN
jgi:hypothetical protein